MNKDFRELLSAFNEHKVKYLIVSGYAVSYHSEPRTTKDLDLFIQSSPENAKAVFQALADFGAPLDGVSVEDFTNPEIIFQMGVPPQRIDLLQKIEGVDFETAWDRRVRGPILAGDPFEAEYISARDLIQNKRAVGRPRDLLDVDDIQAALKATGQPLPHSNEFDR